MVCYRPTPSLLHTYLAAIPLSAGLPVPLPFSAKGLRNPYFASHNTIFCQLSLICLLDSCKLHCGAAQLISLPLQSCCSQGRRYLGR